MAEQTAKDSRSLPCRLKKRRPRHSRQGHLFAAGMPLHIQGKNDQALAGSVLPSADGKMILFTKKKTTMEIPPLSTVVPML